MKTIKWILLAAALTVLTMTAVAGTLGDVSADGKYLYVAQSRLQRSENGLTAAETGRRLLPVAAKDLKLEEVQLSYTASVTKSGHTATVNLADAQKMYTAQNVLDHIVAATNVGNVDGYVRTWFAFEMGKLSLEEFQAAVVLNRNTTDWSWGEFSSVVIDGQKYAVVCAEYNTALKAGKTTAPSLLQVLLHHSVSNETAARLDGNGNDNYEIKAVSRIISDSGAWSSLEPHPWASNG